VEAERYLAPRRARRFDVGHLLERTGDTVVGALWDRLAQYAYAAPVERLDRRAYEVVCPGDADRILRAAERAIGHRIDLLGSGEVELGAAINWLRDFKSGYAWPLQYSRDIDFMTPGQSRDVKCPWELSRMQWVIPLGQAYLLTGEERHATAARELIESWISANPYAWSVNWSCAMEAAIRILTWTWLFHAFAKSTAWEEENFRGRFLVSLYLHADFVDRHFEFSDVNGNHCDADAAGLVFAGLFFGAQGESKRWLDRGWRVLTEEIERQVSEDGVDFEGSVPYHRLVTEFFLLPALFRMRRGLQVPEGYRAKMLAMARFTEAYTRPDGSAPCWGDADDGRALPFGGQGINDHRYLLGWVGEVFGDQATREGFAGDAAECVWLLGLDKAAGFASRSRAPARKSSVLFGKGGYAVLSNESDHVFVDCGPVGMAGRGGHGHNDILSCEIVLDGCHLVADCGAFVYTSSFEARNSFRSTAFHNTPRIDGHEVNRLIHPDELWMLHDDARPEIREFKCGPERDVLTVAHTGYMRLERPILLIRTYVLEHMTHALTIRDKFEGTGSFQIDIPLHLAAGVEVEEAPNNLALRTDGRTFRVEVDPGKEWHFRCERGFLSPSYGVTIPNFRLSWRRSGTPVSLTFRLTRA